MQQHYSSKKKHLFCSPLMREILHAKRSYNVTRYSSNTRSRPIRPFLTALTPWAAAYKASPPQLPVHYALFNRPTRNSNPASYYQYT